MFSLVDLFCIFSERHICLSKIRYSWKMVLLLKKEKIFLVGLSFFGELLREVSQYFSIGKSIVQLDLKHGLEVHQSGV